MKLTTSTRNALREVVRKHTGWDTPEGGDWREEPPKNVVATLPYSLVERGYNIGKLGLADIVKWLAEDGYAMAGTPDGKKRSQVSTARLDIAVALLRKHGYKVEAPNSSDPWPFPQPEEKK